MAVRFLGQGFESFVIDEAEPTNAIECRPKVIIEGFDQKLIAEKAAVAEGVFMWLDDMVLCKVSLLIDVAQLLPQGQSFLGGFERRVVVDIREHLLKIDVERLLPANAVFKQYRLKRDFNRDMEVVNCQQATQAICRAALLYRIQVKLFGEQQSPSDCGRVRDRR
ncbi:MAG TPA: hypothetical protein VFM56_07110 [Solimonas sp.]|nr:hypothetical protein [Solimonas sp.]